nr:MAG TPA: hypothetical protein [Caudoviricetes sp.]
MTERRDKTSENYQRSKADLATLSPQSIYRYNDTPLPP